MEDFPYVNHPRSGVDPRCVLENLARKAFVDQAAELNVVVSEERGAGEQHRESHTQQRDTVPRRPEARRDSNSKPAIIFHLSARVKGSLLERKAGFRPARRQRISCSPTVWIPILNRAVVRVVMKIEGEFID